MIVFAVSGPAVFAIYLLDDVTRAIIASVALCATPLMFLFGAVVFVGSRRLRSTATIVCALSSLVWGVYLLAILSFRIRISMSEPLSSAPNTPELLSRVFVAIALMYPFCVVMAFLFLLAIIATLWLALKVWIPDY